MSKLDRKEAIRRTGLLIGGVIFTPTILGVLNGCTATSAADWSPKYFSNERALLITELSDVIIPGSSTPGASQSGVPQFIEKMVYEAWPIEEREYFLKGLDDFDAMIEENQGRAFTSLPQELKIQEASKVNRISILESHSERPFFLIMKELTILGYMTSENGATQLMRYEPIPGKYESCIPFEEIGKAWA